MHSREKGNIAEEKGVKFLVSQGYEIIDKNFYSRFGEIDIIVKKDNILHFVEVKSGTTFEPIYNVTPTKIKKIIKTLQLYLKKYKLNNAYQIDIIIVKKEIEFIKNITLI